MGQLLSSMEGDRISIDLDHPDAGFARDAAELDAGEQFVALPNRYTRGVLSKYAKLVGSASQGAVLRLAGDNSALSGGEAAISTG